MGDSGEYELEGFLEKLGEKGLGAKRYQRRYFKLEGSELHYYKAVKDSTNKRNSKGFIDLKKVISVEQDLPDAQQQNKRSSMLSRRATTVINTHKFDVATEDRVYHLMASSEKDMMRWVGALQHITAELNVNRNNNGNEAKGSRRPAFRRAQSQKVLIENEKSASLPNLNKTQLNSDSNLQANDNNNNNSNTQNSNNVSASDSNIAVILSDISSPPIEVSVEDYYKDQNTDAVDLIDKAEDQLELVKEDFPVQSEDSIRELQLENDNNVEREKEQERDREIEQSEEKEREIEQQREDRERLQREENERLEKEKEERLARERSEQADKERKEREDQDRLKHQMEEMEREREKNRQREAEIEREKEKFEKEKEIERKQGLEREIERELEKKRENEAKVEIEHERTFISQLLRENIVLNTEISSPSPAFSQTFLPVFNEISAETPDISQVQKDYISLQRISNDTLEDNQLLTTINEIQLLLKKNVDKQKNSQIEEEELVDQINQQKSQLFDLIHQHLHLSASIEILYAKLSYIMHHNNQNFIEDIQKEIEKLQSNSAEVESKLEGVFNKKKSVQDSINEISSEYRKLDNRMHVINERISLSKQSLDLLYEKIKTEKSNEEIDSDIENKISEISTLNNESKNIQQERKDVSRNEKSLENSLALCDKEEAYLQLLLSSNREKISFFKDKLQSSNSHSPDQLKQEIDETKFEINDKKKNRKEIFHTINEICDKISDLFGRFQVVVLKNDKLIQKLQQLMQSVNCHRVTRRRNFSTRYAHLYEVISQYQTYKTTMDMSFEFLKEFPITLYQPSSDSANGNSNQLLMEKLNSVESLFSKSEENNRGLQKKIEALERQLASERKINQELQTNQQLQHQLQLKQQNQHQQKLEKQQRHYEQQIKQLQQSLDQQQELFDQSKHAPSPVSSSQPLNQKNDERYQRFMKEISYLESQLFESKEKINSLEKQIENNEIQRNIELLESEKEKLNILHGNNPSPKHEEEISQLKDKVNQLESELILTRKETKKYKDMTSILEEELEESRELNAVEKKRLNQYMVQINELEEKIRSNPIGILENDLRQKEWEFARIYELYRNLEGEILLLRNDKNSDKETIKRQQEEISSKDNIILQLQEQLFNERNSKNSNAGNVQNISREIARLKAANHAHQSQNAQLEAEIRRLEKEIYILKEIRDKTVVNLNGQIETLRKDYQELRKLALTNGGVDAATVNELDNIAWVKKEYFYSLAIGAKLELSSKGSICNLDISDLYQEACYSVPVQQWHTWITKKFLEPPK